MKSLIVDIINALRYPIKVRVIIWGIKGVIVKREVEQISGRVVPQELLDPILIKAKECVPDYFFDEERRCFYSYITRCNFYSGNISISPLCKAHLKFERGDSNC